MEIVKSVGFSFKLLPGKKKKPIAHFGDPASVQTPSL
jgi:hypothetical protein